MKFFVLTLCVCLISIISQAQSVTNVTELVKNGSFELYESLEYMPTSYVDNIKNQFPSIEWQTTRSVDHYNSESFSNISPFLGGYSISPNGVTVDTSLNYIPTADGYLQPQNGYRYIGIGRKEHLFQELRFPQLINSCTETGTDENKLVPMKLNFWFSPRGYIQDNEYSAKILVYFFTDDDPEFPSVPYNPVNSVFELEFPIENISGNASHIPGNWYNIEHDFYIQYKYIKKIGFTIINNDPSSMNLGALDLRYTYIDNISLKLFNFPDVLCERQCSKGHQGPILEPTTGACTQKLIEVNAIDYPGQSLDGSYYQFNWPVECNGINNKCGIVIPNAFADMNPWSVRWTGDCGIVRASIDIYNTWEVLCYYYEVCDINGEIIDINNPLTYLTWDGRVSENLLNPLLFRLFGAKYYKRKGDYADNGTYYYVVKLSNCCQTLVLKGTVLKASESIHFVDRINPLDANKTWQPADCCLEELILENEILIGNLSFKIREQITLRNVQGSNDIYMQAPNIDVDFDTDLDGSIDFETTSCSDEFSSNCNEYGMKKMENKISYNNIINNNDYDEKISIFPNPTNDNFMIKFINFANDEVFICIYDQTGRIIIEERQELNSQETINVSLTNYPTGMYIVRITAGGHVHTAKIVLAR